MGDLFAKGARRDSLSCGWKTLHSSEGADIANGQSSLPIRSMKLSLAPGGYSDDQMARAACTLANVPHLTSRQTRLPMEFNL